MSGNTFIVNKQSVQSEAIPVVIKNIEGVVVNVGATVEVSNDVGNPLPMASQQLPNSLGPKTAAASLSVALASDALFTLAPLIYAQTPIVRASGGGQTAKARRWPTTGRKLAQRSAHERPTPR